MHIRRYAIKTLSNRLSTTHTLLTTVPPSPFSFCLQNQEIKINDMIRGHVTWNTDTLGDFVLLRSSGLPVYNFCVAIDDALMKVTHVIR